MFQCSGNTKRGYRCKNMSKSNYCHLHLKQYDDKHNCNLNIKKYDKPNDCPVCFEPMNEHNPLLCGHWVHIDCIKKSGKNKCPICRKDNILNNVKFNIKSDNDSDDNEYNDSDDNEYNEYNDSDENEYNDSDENEYNDSDDNELLLNQLLDTYENEELIVYIVDIIISNR